MNTLAGDGLKNNHGKEEWQNQSYQVNKMRIIDNQLIENVTEEARKSPRLRMNYHFHQNLSDKCHRFLNVLEPGTQIPVHHHPTKDETIVILKGKVRVSTYNDDGVQPYHHKQRHNDVWIRL